MKKSIRHRILSAFPEKVFNKASVGSFINIFILLNFGLFKLGAQMIPAHDPVMIKDDSVYYLFCTGNGISVWSSKNLKDWVHEKPVFNEPPKWAVETVTDFKGHIWAPDISKQNGMYYLYYSISSFGKNTSCIGLATNLSLDPANPAFKWTDLGKVVQSVPGRDMWNAIDPNLVLDIDGTPWLTFGSFWDGIKMVRLTSDFKQIYEPQQWLTVAKRERKFGLEDPDPGNAAIEAPFIFRKGEFFYLFVSWDFCCRGPQSNYKIVLGRSTDVRGPYLDKTGKPMNQGGGTVLLEGNEKWYGIGHNSVYTFNGMDYLICHAYDASDKGKPKLIVKNISWDDDAWPAIKE